MDGRNTESEIHVHVNVHCTYESEFSRTAVQAKNMENLGIVSHILEKLLLFIWGAGGGAPTYRKV